MEENTLQEASKNTRAVYSLDHLKPEVVAVAFAKCSRSPESFATIAEELTDAKSADFHEKWVVGYGHSSVAEHANLHLAIENVSILATKVIEDNRLASFTEKSTRYQIFDKTKYYKPQNILASSLSEEYQKTLDYIFDTYTSLNEPMRDFIVKKYPKTETDLDKVYNVITKARVCDNIRYLLPTATLTNLGMTANARNFERVIAKLLSHPLQEMQDIGTDIKQCALGITPTLIKFANVNDYLKNTPNELTELSKNLLPKEINPVNPVEVVQFDPEAENKLVAALLYRGSDLPYKQIWQEVKKMPLEAKEKIIDVALKNRASFDQPLRELEHVYYTFDILMDYGAFRDVQRHRMNTQTNQDVTIINGFETPEEIIEAGLESQFKEVMERAANLYQKMYPQFPKEAQYAVPLAFRKRTLFTWNLRELHHFISLRSGQKGHISYRRVAQACWQKLNEIHPLLAKYIRVDMSSGSSSWASTMFKPEYSYKPKLD
ncbi:MAG TPA: FAD-dependent thymidylate synthase [Candidatus Magasanikbacteria bacterium]|nr:FAD-dependent thymidylate synthase [Candidatus Magasanikbacteria bacterium]